MGIFSDQRKQKAGKTLFGSIRVKAVFVLFACSRKPSELPSITRIASASPTFGCAQQWRVDWMTVEAAVPAALPLVRRRHACRYSKVHLPRSCRIVDIATAEFSLALRHSSGRCRCKLWPQSENLVFENDFNAHGHRSDSDRAKLLSAKESARRVTFITSGMEIGRAHV